MLKVYYLRISDFAAYSDDYFLPQVSRETACVVSQYKNAKIRRTKLIGEMMSRKLLKTVLGLQGFQMVKGEHGKPYVKESDVPAFFNLSHSGDYIVCAVSDREVGVDIERKGKVRMEVARRFFHPSEVCLLDKVQEEEREELFFCYWSVKESFLKYTGSGLSSPLSGFEVCFENERICLKKEHSRIPVYVRECLIDQEYKCFVCSELPEVPEIELFHLG